MSDGPDSLDELEAELRSFFRRTDPIPAEVTEFAQAALGWRRLDADLAELLADSALESDAVALARGDAGSRALSFGGVELTIDVEITSEGEAHTVLGQLAPPPASATIEVQAGDGDIVAGIESDTLGRFRLKFDGAGRFRFRVVQPDLPPVETSWFNT